MSSPPSCTYQPINTSCSPPHLQQVDANCIILELTPGPESPQDILTHQGSGGDLALGKVCASSLPAAPNTELPALGLL